MRVPIRSDGTRSGVNCTRWKVPPSTLATVEMVSVLARPGTPSSSRCPFESRATRTRSSIPSWPTITRLISNSAASSWVCAAAASPTAASRGLYSVTDRLLPGRAGALVGHVGLLGSGTPYVSGSPAGDSSFPGTRTGRPARRRDVDGRGAADVDKSHHSASDAIRHDLECLG